MRELTIDNGVQLYTINGCELRFNPTDLFFAEKLAALLDELDGKQKEREVEMKGADTMKVFELARRYDVEMRERLDAVLEAPVSAAVAGAVNIYAMSDGLPLFANIIMALWEEIDKGIAAETKKQNPRLEALLRKYGKK